MAGDPELGLDYSRVLHAEQEYEWRRPLGIGETISAEATIEDVRAKGGLEFLDLRTVIPRRRPARRSRSAGAP